MQKETADKIKETALQAVIYTIVAIIVSLIVAHILHRDYTRLK